MVGITEPTWWLNRNETMGEQSASDGHSVIISNDLVHVLLSILVEAILLGAGRGFRVFGAYLPG